MATTLKLENWHKPTPAKWRNIGDALLALSVVIASAVVLIPIPDNVKVIIMAASTFVGGVGKFITKLAYDPNSK